MNSTARKTAATVALVLAAAAAVAAAVAALWWAMLAGHLPGLSQRIDADAGSIGTALVMHTPGGLLEVATVSVEERFTRSDTKQFWGIDLGTTVSQIQMPVVYRYHIEMQRRWPMTLLGKTCVVRAGEVRPSLPVAFDTAKLQKYSLSGWARFNKDENLQALEQSVTAALGTRATLPRYRKLATEAAREAVAEFVTLWLLKESQWRRDPEYRVIVLFPGEAMPAAAPLSTAGESRN